MKSLFEKVEESCIFLKKRFKNKIPHIAILLGSGFGSLAEELEALGFIFYKDIPYFPIPTVPGHDGKLWWGEKKDKSFVVLQGRVHFYEGYKMEEVTFPIRVLALWGVKILIVTASVGGISEDLNPGDLLLIKDHVNFIGTNPLIGINDTRFGERFVDMSEAYDSEIRELLKSRFNLKEAVYAGLSGPSYETPAEVKALKFLGADVVGMSVVPEVIVAKQMKLKVLGIVGVANKAIGTEGVSPITHEKVLETMKTCKNRLKEILSFCLEEL
ncbi:MAG: purine-nucleoside phosphorylase [Synergistetes bacterium]|nr:purine-nucleoside phosphorylase [Synergistota bacterium]MCX8128222.1 purine-nucleoside phosphorylase [Synergistota bacterium]MDW8192669.1 purine-nucleoside phosphorylase [Synergistota bacterium]